jgi:hypothetical protein
MKDKRMDPAEKYRDQVDLAHKMAMDAIAFANQLLEPQAEQIDRFLDAERQSHSIGHILDPTLYRDQINSDSFALQVRMARAAQAFLREMAAIKSEIATPKS